MLIKAELVERDGRNWAWLINVNYYHISNDVTDQKQHLSSSILEKTTTIEIGLACQINKIISWQSYWVGQRTI